MKKLPRAPLFWSLCLSALFIAACSSIADEESISSIQQDKDEISTLSSSSDETSSATTPTSSANGSSTKQSSDSDTQETDSQSSDSDTQQSDPQSSDGSSIKPTITCPSSHPVLDWIGDCHSCDDESSFDPEETESCEKICNGKNGNTKRVYSRGECRLETCPDDKPLMSFWGDCRSCKYDGPVEDTTNCSKCSNRKVENGYCVIASCEGRPLIDDNGFCYPCSTSLSVQTVTGECKSKCPNRRESGSWSFGEGANIVEGTWCYYDSEGSE